ncbi:MAG: hypothetical protein AAFP02_26080, partial [Bacteroidota bacterium]
MKEHQPTEPNPLELEKLKQEFPTTKPEAEENVLRPACPSCGTTAGAEHINIQDKIAKCGGCGAVYSFQQELGGIQSTTETASEKREQVMRPAGLEVDFFQGELEFSMVQPTGGGWIVMSVLTAFFAILLYLIHVKKGISIYWPGGFASLVTFFVYKQWNSRNEKIYITVDDVYLHIKYRPKNFIKDKRIPVKDLDQLYDQPGDPNLGSKDCT